MRQFPRPYTHRVERILVTGAATWTGTGLIRRLAGEADTEVIGVDDLEARIPTEFHQMRLDTLDFANRVVNLAPTTVMHLQTEYRSEDTIPMSVQALLGALSRLSSLRRIIVLSDLAVHGTGPRLPSVLTTDTTAAGDTTRYERALREMEASIASFASDRKNVVVTVLRCAPLLGRTTDGVLPQFLTTRVVPTILGYDPRLQFLHEDDAVGVLEHAFHHPTPGTFDVAADGQIYLSRVLRLGRRIPQPLPERQFRRVLRAMPGPGLPEHLIRLIRHGRVVDPTWDVLGYQPGKTCRETVLSGYGRDR